MSYNILCHCGNFSNDTYYEWIYTYLSWMVDIWMKIKFGVFFILMFL